MLRARASGKKGSSDPQMQSTGARMRAWTEASSSTRRRSRLRRDRAALAHPSDGELSALLLSLFDFPGVPESWRQPDFSIPSEPTLILRFRREALELAFLTTLTVLNAPQNVTLEELSIESYFPLDGATAERCAELARG
jgi:MmyB-like transcription regulator ligand binding domain